MASGRIRGPGASGPLNLLVVTLCLLQVPGCLGLTLEAAISQHGVVGTVTFAQDQPGQEVRIHVNLTSVEESTSGASYSWGIYEFPVDYSLAERCGQGQLGQRPLVDLDAFLNKLSLAEEVGPDEAEATTTLASAAPDGDIQVFTTGAFNLTGDNGVWGQSLVLQRALDQQQQQAPRICASLVPLMEDPKVRLEVAEARFTSPVAGSVWFLFLRTDDDRFVPEAKVISDVFHVTQPEEDTNHHWDIYITDILDTKADTEGQRSGGCNFLQKRYNPTNLNGEGCSSDNPELCRLGDLQGKFGPVKVGKERGGSHRKVFSDRTGLTMGAEILGEGAPLSLFLVIHDPNNPDSFLDCSKIKTSRSKVAVATVAQDGIHGQVAFRQESRFQPVVSSFAFKGLGEGAGSFHVHQFPVPPKQVPDEGTCGLTGGHFNPTHVDPSTSPKTGKGSFDRYEVGDLSGKYGGLEARDQIQGSRVDPTLTLFGPNSVVGRSIVVHKTPVPNRWVCANIVQEGVELLTASATFTYPVAGRVIFRQDRKDPGAETTIFVETLLYSDGTKNMTEGHDWHVHVDPPGTDFFNWTGRCLSAGPHFNPDRVPNREPQVYQERCVDGANQYRCELGDLVGKHRRPLRVAGRKRDAAKTTDLFTDSYLPLSGPNSIVGRSLVIHDKHAPEHRGNRMACVKILRNYRHKAVAREWFGNGVKPAPIRGRLVFVQDTPYDTTTSKVSLLGMGGVAAAYHVHLTPVRPHLEFPCTGDAVGGHFNPWQVDPSQSPPSSAGTPDLYEVGDLSGKYGGIEDMDDFRGLFNDTNLPLFGGHSIVGRSVVVHKKDKGQRWACASVGWGFSPGEAREVRAIASFHHPGGFAWGFIRFSQVVYNDGSMSDTTVEVRLKYPGNTNLKKTEDHDWSIYVSPVGHDAAIEFPNARCTAAGYRWNPTHIQLADPNDRSFYGEECGRDYPLRCEVGDLSGKHGRVSVGGRTYVVNDPHLPLQGDWFNTAVGKSVVVHGPDGSPDRMACANIEEDRLIVKSVAVEKKDNRFSVAEFMEEVRAIMGVPEWFLYTDSRKTESPSSTDKCVQLVIQFAGPHALKLEQDFEALLRTGRQATPSLSIPGFVPDEKRKTELEHQECNKGAKLAGQKGRTSKSESAFGRVAGSAQVSTLAPALISCWALIVALSSPWSSSW